MYPYRIRLTDGGGALFYKQIMTPKEMWPPHDNEFGWLGTEHMSSIMQMFTKRSIRRVCPYKTTRIAFIDPFISSYWCKEYERSYVGKESTWNFPPGYVEVYGESHPFPTYRQWGRDVDTLYIAHNVNNNHWVALEVGLLKKRINVYDSFMICNTDEQIRESCKAYSKFIPLLIQRMAELKDGKGTKRKVVKSYTVYRMKNQPQQAHGGDCGIYALKFIECLALGCRTDGLDDSIMGFARVKFAAELFDEIESESAIALTDPNPRGEFDGDKGCQLITYTQPGPLG